jgi:hypothetical protein
VYGWRRIRLCDEVQFAGNESKSGKRKGEHRQDKLVWIIHGILVGPASIAAIGSPETRNRKCLY